MINFLIIISITDTQIGEKKKIGDANLKSTHPSVYPEVLRAHAQKSPFFLSCFDHFGEKYQKLFKNHDFENCRLKVFLRLFQNGQNKIGKKGDLMGWVKK